MREIYFDDFRTYVIQHMKQIETIDYELDSIEWFLLRYLRRIVTSIESESGTGRVEGSMRSLVRFYVDNMWLCASGNGVGCRKGSTSSAAHLIWVIRLHYARSKSSYGKRTHWTIGRIRPR